MTTKDTKAILFADSSLGRYIPQRFAQTVDRSLVQHVDPEDWDELEKGPDDSDYYWEAWDEVEVNAIIQHPKLGPCRLVHDEDLWVVPEGEVDDFIRE